MFTLKGRFVTLQEITEDDVSTLFRWRNDPIFTGYCSTRRNLVDIVQFRRELRSDLEKDRHLQCIILRKQNPVGTIYSYNLNQTDGYVFVTLYITEPFCKRGYGAETLGLFTLYLFQEFGLYKIYVEVYSYNWSVLQALLKSGFEEEGRFKGHRVFENRRYDLVRLAFFRDKLEHVRRFVERLTQKF